MPDGNDDKPAPINQSLDDLLKARKEFQDEQERAYLARIEHARVAAEAYRSEFSNAFSSVIEPVMTEFTTTFFKHGHSLVQNRSDLDIPQLEPRVYYSLRMDGQSFDAVSIIFMGKGPKQNVLLHVSNGNQAVRRVVFRFDQLNRKSLEQTMLKLLTAELP